MTPGLWERLKTPGLSSPSHGEEGVCVWERIFHTVNWACLTHLKSIQQQWGCTFLILFWNSEQLLHFLFHHFLVTLTALFSVFPRFFILWVQPCEFRHWCSCVCVCVCSWMTGHGLWTLRPGWRIERPLEAPWKLLQPELTPSRGLRSWGREIKTAQKSPRGRCEAKDPGSIYSPGKDLCLCRICKRVSTVSKKGIKTRKSMLLRNVVYSHRTGWNITLRGYARPDSTQLMWLQDCSERCHMSDACGIFESWFAGTRALSVTFAANAPVVKSQSEAKKH